LATKGTLLETTQGQRPDLMAISCEKSRGQLHPVAATKGLLRCFNPLKEKLKKKTLYMN